MPLGYCGRFFSGQACNMFTINGFIQLLILLAYCLMMVTYKISIEGSRYFVCDKTVCPNQNI